MYQWIQIPLAEARELEASGKILKDSGYAYLEPMTGEAMVKYQVDSCVVFQERMETKKFGGNLSVQMETGEKPLISWGHDKCIYKQFIMTKKHWVGPNGETAIVPKDEDWAS